MVTRTPNPGELRHQIVIESITPGQTQDAYGQSQPVYEQRAARRAKIIDKRGVGLQLTQVGSRATINTVEITFRYFAGLTANMRIRTGGLVSDETNNLPVRYFNILGIENLETRNVWHIITAVEVKA